MATNMNIVEVIHRETVKPSSPTPHHLKTHKLGFIDQFVPEMYFPLLLFYPHDNGDSDRRISITEKTQHLRKTLSQTLTHFYPLAGRIASSFTMIECSDDGAEFLVARINCSMLKILKKPDTKLLRQFLAAEPESKEARLGPLLLVQATFFECGGMAIGLSVSHNVMDAASLPTFLNSWSAMALGSGDQIVVPEFRAASLLPPVEFSNYSEPPVAEFVQEKLRTRRYVFEPTKIAALQCKAASESVKNPTRVEAVCALIWKSAMEASKSNKGSLKPSVFCQVVNLRQRTIPPLPENLVGNLIGNFPAKLEQENDEIDLKILVAKLRKVMEQVKGKYSKGLDVKELQSKGLDVKELQEAHENCVNLITNNEIESYCCSSWCRFSFYNADFGWEKPAWVSISGVGFKNFIFLLSTRNGDGIEAWFTLREEEMELVERNQELLDFAALNPSVV